MQLRKEDQHGSHRQMEDILKMHRLQQDFPVMVTKIPKHIMDELEVWVNYSKEIKSHPLSKLKALENVGYLAGKDGKIHNTYQTSIPARLVEESFWLAWVIRLGHKYWGSGQSHRFLKLRELRGHFDRYDLWTNFCYKGDDNPSHYHEGFLSGVMYYKNHGHPTIFTDYGMGYEGLDGTMVMFPANMCHHVEPQIVNEERITLSFNLTN